MSAPRELQSIGINIFITHFETFYKLKNRIDIAKFCIENKISNESGALIRGGYMEQVINNKNILKECLNYIIYQSKKTSQDNKNKAKYILDNIDSY